MTVKRVLIYLPLVLSGLLIQSFFWVPTYDTQGAANPQRLVRYIEGSSGDAEILNPILNADTASSAIVAKVFDGLLGYDDQLKLRPRLARRWTQTEEAYLALDLNRKIGDGPLNSQEKWLAFLQKHLTDESFGNNILSIEWIPPETVESQVSAPVLDNQGNTVMEQGRPKTREIPYTLNRPPRLKFNLKTIDQDFFKSIHTLLGEAYFGQFPYESFITATDPKSRSLLKSHFPGILPVTEHNPVLEFELREDVRFHDGHPFDAGDVEFTYQALMEPRNGSPRTSDFEPIKRLEVLGPYRVRVVYKRLFSSAINSWGIGILPEHLLNKKAMQQEAQRRDFSEEKRENMSMRDSEFNRNPIGTGAFRFREWKGDVLIRLVRNEDYWDGPPEYKEYVMRILPDALTRELEFYSGAIDDYSAEPHQVARLKNDPAYQSFSTVTGSYSYIGYNLRNPLFADPKVRRALSMAINVDQIIKFILYGEGARVSGPYAKNTHWYDPDTPLIPYDPEGAIKILNDLGWTKNAEGYLEKEGKVFEFKLISNNGNAIRKNIMAIAQNNWKKIGVKCHTQLFEWAVFLKDFVNEGKFDAVVLGWVMGIDPDIYQIWHSSQAGPQQLNFVGYKNPEADRLIERIRKEYQVEQQIRLARQLHRMIAEDQPYTFLFASKVTRLLDKKIVMVKKEPDGTVTYQKIYPTRDGKIDYYFNRWKKLAEAPLFAG